MNDPSPEAALRDIAPRLHAMGVRFALVLCNRNLDLGAVQENIARIIKRGFSRNEDLFAKLDRVLAEARADET